MADRMVSGISVRLMRVTTEVAYVVVPLTERLMASFGKDTDEGGLLEREACLLGADPGVEWVADGTPATSVHPIQMAKPET